MNPLLIVHDFINYQCVKILKYFKGLVACVHLLSCSREQCRNMFWMQIELYSCRGTHQSSLRMRRHHPSLHAIGFHRQRLQYLKWYSLRMHPSTAHVF